MRAPQRAYVDASVFGGVFDEEFSSASGAFFDQVDRSLFVVLTSALVGDELSAAPSAVRELFQRILTNAELVEISPQALELQNAYIDAGILTPKWADDALHVALATTAAADLIVSWNFRHIVHFDKVPKYNAVNALRGYREIAIHSPSEVIAYEDEEDI